jgi:hypothetical protein
MNDHWLIESRELVSFVRPAAALRPGSDFGPGRPPPNRDAVGTWRPPLRAMISP